MAWLSDGEPPSLSVGRVKVLAQMIIHSGSRPSNPTTKRLRIKHQFGYFCIFLQKYIIQIPHYELIETRMY